MNAFKQTCDNCGWNRVATGGYARSEECPRCGGNSFSDTKSTPVQADKSGAMYVCSCGTYIMPGDTVHTHTSPKEKKPCPHGVGYLGNKNGLFCSKCGKKLQLQEDLEERVERLILGTGEYYGLSNYDRGGYIQPILNLIRERETAARKDELERLLKMTHVMTYPLRSVNQEARAVEQEAIEARLKELEWLTIDYF